MEYNKWIFSLYAEAVASATALNALARDKGSRGGGRVGQLSRLDMNYFNRVGEVNGYRIADLVGLGGALRGKARRRGGGGGAGGGGGDGGSVDNGFPVFLLNMEHRKDRREHMLSVNPRNPIRLVQLTTTN